MTSGADECPKLDPPERIQMIADVADVGNLTLAETEAEFPKS
jgi:hypothetical protein